MFYMHSFLYSTEHLNVTALCKLNILLLFLNNFNNWINVLIYLQSLEEVKQISRLYPMVFSIVELSVIVAASTWSSPRIWDSTGSRCTSDVFPDPVSDHSRPCPPSTRERNQPGE